MNSINERAGFFKTTNSYTFPLTSIYAVSTAFVVGVIILTLVGFASPEVIHNAAHDLRHSMVFPCH
jgi:cobalt transporter subunit CbtB